MSQDLPVPLPPELEARLDKALSMMPWNKAQHEVVAVLSEYARACMAPLQERADALLAVLSEAGISIDKSEHGYTWTRHDARADALEAALREFVDLKALKSRMERSIAASMAHGNNPSEQYHAWKNDYNRRQPIAWATANALINPTGGES